MIRVGMVSGPSRLDDASFLFSAWSGLTQARSDLGIRTTILEAMEEGDLKTNVDFLTYDGYDVIWAVGYNTEEVVSEAAPRYPDTRFCTVDVEFASQPENVVSVLFSEQDGAFLAGYAAARLTTTGRIGFLGGEECPLIARFREGFVQGAATADPEVAVSVRHTGSFIKYNAGRVAAESLYDEKCDIVFHAAGSAGKGAIRVAKDRNRFIIGVDSDQTFLAPGNVITSMVKRVDRAVAGITRELVEGRSGEGACRRFGLGDNAIELTPIAHPQATSALDDELADIRERLINGSISVTLPG